MDLRSEGPPRTGLLLLLRLVNRGVALHNGKVFVGTLDGRLVALDQRSGVPLWSVQTTDPAKAYSITAAPRIARDKVVIGNGGAGLRRARLYHRVRC